MADHSAIEWTDATWNPTVGCTVLTPGCTHCYAMKVAYRHERQSAGAGRVSPYSGLAIKSKAGAVWTGDIRLNKAAVDLPLRWKQPRRIFVNSMSDLFHEGLGEAAIDQVFAVMARSPQHTFQILTKRAQRLHDYVTAPERSRAVAVAASLSRKSLAWPVSNVWLGVSVEDQLRGNQRIPLLLETPAALRFLSCEPLLGPIDLVEAAQRRGLVDWVIIGGESGPGARPFDLGWARSLAAQCKSTGSACFIKQLGAQPCDGKEVKRLKNRKGGDWGEWPPDLRIRDFPATAA